MDLNRGRVVVLRGHPVTRCFAAGIEYGGVVFCCVDAINLERPAIVVVGAADDAGIVIRAFGGTGSGMLCCKALAQSL